MIAAATNERTTSPDAPNTRAPAGPTREARSRLAPARARRPSSVALLRRRSCGGDREGTAPPLVHEVLSSPGQSLGGPVRKPMEQRFGEDFSGVRVHTDTRAAESARAIGAIAYAVGSHIVFAEGQYQPTTAHGRRLLAHELAHVAQQPRVEVGSGPIPIGAAGSADERFAEAAADAALRGRRAPPRATAAGAPVVRRLCGDRPIPPCPTGYTSVPSNPGIGSLMGQWIGLQYRASRGISSYLLVDWWLYSSRGKIGTIYTSLATTDPLVLGALQATPDWARIGTERIDILDSDRDEVYEIKPVRGAEAGPAQLAGYLASLRALAPQAPAWMGSRPRDWHAGIWEPEPYMLPISVGPGGTSFVCMWSDPAEPGVIVYDILNCRGGVAPPVYVPEPAVERLLEWARGLLNRLEQWFEDLGVGWKIVVGALAAIAVLALAVLLLPEEIIAAVGAFLAAIGAAILEAFGVLGAAGTAIAEGLGSVGTWIASAAGIGGLVLQSAPASAEPAPKPKAPPTPAEPIPSVAPKILQAIERAPAAGHRAAAVKRHAATLHTHLHQPPGHRTSAPQAGVLGWIPADADFCLLEPVTHEIGGSVYVDAMLFMHYPVSWGARWGGLPRRLRVVSRAPGSVTLEFPEALPWDPYVLVPKGRRFVYTEAAHRRCAATGPGIDAPKAGLR